MDSISQEIDRLLALPEAQEWIWQFAEVLYDSEARRRRAQAIRAAVAERTDALGDEDRAKVVDGLVSTLARRARLIAGPRTAQESAPLLSGSDLTDCILEHYPAPIAIPYRAMDDEAQEGAAFGSLLDTFEATIHFLAIVAVSAYLRTDLANAACNKVLLPQLLRAKWSVGQIMGLLRDIVRLAGDCQGHLPYPELPRHLFRSNGKPTAALENLDAFVELRNRDWGHGTGRTGKYYHGLYERTRPDLDDALARMSWLAAWKLIRPVQLDTAGRVCMADLYEGERPRFRRKNITPLIRQEDLIDADGDVRIDRDCLLLVAPDQSKYLPLFPLSLFPVERGAAFFLLSPEWKQEAHSLRLTKAEYVAYKAECPNHAEERGEYPATRLERHVERLRRMAPDSMPARVEPAASGDPDFSLPDVRNEQQSHLRHFVGRGPYLQAIAGWIEGKTEGGYLLLLGSPGQGKSALMAELANRESAHGWCLLHMIKSHPSPLRFLAALISQVAQLTQTQFGPEAYQGDVDDLRNSLVRALAKLRDVRGRAVVVLDALDELPPASTVTFLPPQLPEGVRVVLSCRPNIPLVNALKNRLQGQHEIREVPPLTEADFHELLEKRLEVGVRRKVGRVVDYAAVFGKLGGHPLFLHHFIDRVEHDWKAAQEAGAPFTLDLDALPATNDAYFRDVYNRVRRRQPDGSIPPEGQVQARLLHLLCVAREGLRVDDLADLLAVDGPPLLLGECRDRLEAISPYLLDTGNGRYKPWHQGLTDYVRGEELGPAGIRAVEQTFRRWLEQPEQAYRPYALRHRIDHLLAGDDTEAAARWLTDWRFLEAKAEAGQVFGLATDFRKTLAQLPREHAWYRRLRLLEEALRRELHFLDRHPTCLFQALWNLGWWYDHPDAAKHYDLEIRKDKEPYRWLWPFSFQRHSVLGQRTGKEPLPWERSEPRLHAFLDAWRQQKEQAQPGFNWLRSVRPPSTQLGTHLKAVFRGHEGQVASVTVSPDGTWIVSGSFDKTVRVWDVTTGELRLCLTGHESRVWSVAVSPDGSLIVSGSTDNTVRVWDATTGEQRLCLKGHISSVVSVAVSPDGTWIVSGSDDKTLRIWDAATGEQRLCLTGHGDSVWNVAVSPDGKRIVSGSDDRTVRVWDAITGQQRLCLKGHEDSVRSVAVSPDGSWIVSGSHDYTARVWDAATGEQRLCLTGHGDSVWNVAVSPDGTWIVSGSWDKTVRVWDATTGEQRLCLKGHEDSVWSVAVSPDGKRIVSGSWDKTVRVWDVSTGEQRLCLKGHEESVRSVAVSPDGTWIISGSSDRTVCVLDATTGECRKIVRDRSFDEVVQDLGPIIPPFLTVSRNALETTVSIRGGPTLAWVSPRMQIAKTCAEPPRLVGVVGSDLLIYAIEGDLPPVPQQE